MKWFLYLMLVVSIVAYVIATELETRALERRASAAARSELEAWREVQVWRATVFAAGGGEAEGDRQKAEGGGR